MRFASVPRAKQSPLRSAGAELIRKLVAGEPLARLQAPQPKPQDLPPDLDQRVRLVGEW
jgi:hypothetical protein